MKEAIDLDFLYPLTKGFYGDSGQKSIDPVVFFKLCLVGYLENIISDRKLIGHCSMRLDIFYVIGYYIDEELSATVHMFGKGERETVFGHLLSRRIPEKHSAGQQQGGQVYEEQGPEYGGTGFRDPDPVLSLSQSFLHTIFIVEIYNLKNIFKILLNYFLLNIWTV